MTPIGFLSTTAKRFCQAKSEPDLQYDSSSLDFSDELELIGVSLTFRLPWPQFIKQFFHRLQSLFF